MRKKNIPTLLFTLSALAVPGFAFSVFADRRRYDPIVTSAPFYVNVIFRALEFLLPGVILFMAGMLLKKKYGR